MKEFETLTHLIKNRRSIFPNQYTDEKVPDEWIRQILENANWAPTHKHTEPWRFHIFTGNSLERLSQYMGAHYKETTEPDKYSERKYQKRKKNPLKSSHVIAICMQRDSEERIPEWEEIAAVACAVQNMWLSCTALGLGTYWSTPDAILEADDFLGLKEGQRCLGLFYIGKWDATINIQSMRNPIEEKVVWHE